ncbi:XdhC family protein [Agaribacterium sp. ZY112]|uniref:XdhC family protein n=1 Tax=Agaribacterium sp. ZY112 TaxID=3233574 RepID=UPI003524F5ED
MQTSYRELLRAFDKQKSYVLACIVSTRGASYQKAGAMMLITEQGRCYGLLSGGCLEADIALHAKHVFSTAEPKLLHYDLKGEEAVLWGLGAGCEGEVELVLQLINPANAFLYFDRVLAALSGGGQGCYKLSLCTNKAEYVEAQQAECEDTIAQNTHKELLDQRQDKTQNNTLCIPVEAAPLVVIVGAGPDVDALITMIEQLAWRVRVCDHREAQLQRFSSKFETVCSTALCEHSLSGASAIVIMSHNLARDQQALALALASSLNYIGLLGPEQRKQKLLKALGLTNKAQDKRLHGPIGLDLGGRGPEAIALSICAELQLFFSSSQKEKALAYLC